jgi:hypothetical protein
MFDNNRAANAAFHSAQQSNTGAATSRGGFSIRMPMPENKTAMRIPGPSPSPFKATEPAKPRSDLLGACRRCGKMGHFVKECPMSFDVRYMTTEERDVWAQQILCDADVATAKAREIAQEEEEAEVPREDFGHRNE